MLAATGVGRDSGATLDLLPALDVLQLINAEDERMPSAVAAVLPQLAMVVDVPVESARITLDRSGGVVRAALTNPPLS